MGIKTILQIKMEIINNNKITKSNSCVSDNSSMNFSFFSDKCAWESLPELRTNKSYNCTNIQNHNSFDNNSDK